MPPAAIAIAAAIGAAGAAIAGTSILVGALVYGGLAAAASLLAPKPPSFNPNSVDPASIDTRRRVVHGVEAARWILGKSRTGGSLKFLEEVGDDDLWMAIALSEGACDGIEKVWIDSEEVQFTTSGNTLTIGGD
ncbi:MAG: hypothetical protein OXF51_05790, partial [Alphaproteobacteria bacterium]|nr:hypothetical protein [Alphaproteobacteria bacterium]